MGQSSTIALISAAPRVRPRILARTASRLSGGAAGVTVTRLAGRFGEAPERRFGKADLVGPDQIVVLRDQQRGQQHPRIPAEFDPAEASKDFRTQCL